MWVLITSGGPIHFSGIAAVLFSIAVLAIAAVLVAHIVDHYDRRDVEESYAVVRRNLWWVAGGAFVLAWVTGCTSSVIAPGRVTFVGLIRTEDLAGFLESAAVTQTLRPIEGSMVRWLWMSVAWFVGVSLVLRAFKFRENPPPAVAVLYCYLVLLPLLATITLLLMWHVASGELLADTDSSELRRATVAWASTLLVACAGLWWLVIVATIGLVLKAAGVRAFAASFDAVGEDVAQRAAVGCWRRRVRI
jgi:hypothetical protein